MAASVLRRGEAVVWLPVRPEGARVLPEDLPLRVLRAERAEGATLTRQSLAALAGTGAVHLVLDARDVLWLSPLLPPLAGARLMQALPNAIEDALLQDVSACAIVPDAPRPDGRLNVAVVDRAWLEVVVSAFEAKGIRVRSVRSALWTLPARSTQWSVACVGESLALRFGDESGFGWSAGQEVSEREAALEAALSLALHTQPGSGPIQVWIDEPGWQAPLAAVAQRLGQTITVEPLSLTVLEGPDLLRGREGVGRRMWAQWDARAWRWPAGLAAAVLVAALVGLNLHWLALEREARDLRRALESRFRQSFPQAQVVVDPLLQMQREVDRMRGEGAQEVADDPLPLLARFAAALGSAGIDAVSAIEARPGQLTVRFQAPRVESQAVRDQLREACARAGLMLQFDSGREPVARVSRRSGS